MTASHLLPRLLSLLGLLASATAQVYYVDAATGLDAPARNGLSPATAWRSVDYAISRNLPTGATVNILPGVYPTGVVLSRDIRLEGLPRATLVPNNSAGPILHVTPGAQSAGTIAVQSLDFVTGTRPDLAVLVDVVAPGSLGRFSAENCLFDGQFATVLAAVQVTGCIVDVTECLFLGDQSAPFGVSAISIRSVANGFVQSNIDRCTFRRWQTAIEILGGQGRVSNCETYRCGIGLEASGNVRMEHCTFGYGEPTFGAPPVVSAVQCSGSGTLDVFSSILWMPNGPNWTGDDIRVLSGTVNVHSSILEDSGDCSLGSNNLCPPAITAPGFVNGPTGDYRLLPNSPAVDSAATPAAVATDLTGGPRSLDASRTGNMTPDRGARELSSVSLTAALFGGMPILNTGSLVDGRTGNTLAVSVSGQPGDAGVLFLGAAVPFAPLPLYPYGQLLMDISGAAPISFVGSTTLFLVLPAVVPESQVELQALLVDANLRGSLTRKVRIDLNP